MPISQAKKHHILIIKNNSLSDTVSKICKIIQDKTDSEISLP